MSHRQTLQEQSHSVVYEVDYGGSSQEPQCSCQQYNQVHLKMSWIVSVKALLAQLFSFLIM